MHGTGIWKASKEDNEYVQVFGQWEFDRLFNGTIEHKDGTTKVINYDYKNNHAT